MQNNSNKNWENKGWEAMQQMLDQDLPVEEKEPKRRAIFWYWAAAGIALLIGVVFMNLQRTESNLNMENQLVPIADISETKAADVFDKNNTENIQKIDSQAIDSQSFMKKETAKKKEFESNNSTPFLKIENSSLNFAQKQLAENSKNLDSKSAKSIVLDRRNVVDNLNSETKITAIDLLENSNENNSIFQNKIEAEFDRLPILFASLNLAKIELSEAPEPISEKVQKVERSTKKVKTTFRLAAGTLVDFAPRVSGFELGGSVDFGRKNSKISFQTGLNYRFSRRQEIRLEWTEFPVSRANEAYDLAWGTQHNGSGGIDPAAISESYYKSGEQIISYQKYSYHFLSIPINIQYQFRPKWTVSLGLETSFLLNYIPRSLGLDDDSTSADMNLALSDSFKLKKIDLAATAAIKYDLSENWNLKLKVHHGNLFQGDNWQVDNRFLSAGGSFVF